MNLARTRNGTMIHRRDCFYLQPRRRFSISLAVPWLWADDKPVTEVATWIVRLGYSTCKHCEPIPWHDFAIVALINGLVPTEVSHVNN